MTDKLIDPLTRLQMENVRLSAIIDRYKAREKLFVRAIEELVDTPSTSVVSVAQNKKEVEVFFTTGAVWRRVTRCRETPASVEFFEDWVPVKAVPTTRPAIVQDLNDAMAKLAVQSLLPGRVA